MQLKSPLSVSWRQPKFRKFYHFHLKSSCFVYYYFVSSFNRISKVLAIHLCGCHCSCVFAIGSENGRNSTLSLHNLTQINFS